MPVFMFYELLLLGLESVPKAMQGSPSTESNGKLLCPAAVAVRNLILSANIRAGAS